MRVYSFVLLLMLPFIGLAQKKLQRSYLKFGDIKEADFEPKAYEVDSNASAIVLADIGESKFEGNNDGFFSIVHKHHKRIRIMNKNGFDNATVSIGIYNNGSKEEKLDDLEAFTYNVENGKVVVTKLDKASIFKDKITKNYTIKKFTFPNIKEGSILEYRYTIITPYYQYLRDWEFQGSMPRLWSEYYVSVPSMFDYVMFNQGYGEFDISDATITTGRYSILVPGETAVDRSEVFNWSGNVYENVWAMKNVPALKQEAFTTTVDNHIQKIEFQLRAIRWPGGKVDDIMGTWHKLADALLKDADFGADLDKNSFVDKDINNVVAHASSDIDKARVIFEYVRDNFTCTDHSSKWLSNPLKKIYQAKNGNVADINLLLTAIYRNKGFEATPVILSTKDHGKPYELYPLINKFNYVITRVKVGENYYLLDASHNRLGFGKLPEEVYNGYARIVDNNPLLIPLFADSLVESKVTSIFIINNENGKGLTGTFTTNPGYFESYELREKLTKTTREDYFKELKKSFSFEIEMENTSIDSLKMYEEPVSVKYDFHFTPEDDILYLNPMLSEATKENPFTAAERRYPVEMPYAFNETYVFNMEIPKGYKVEELPKSVRIKLNDDEGLFEYIIGSSGQNIQLRSKIVINKATFSKDDYQTLRDFFAMVVKKHSEQIVLKKNN
jgi:hypothetical protein